MGKVKVFGFVMLLLVVGGMSSAFAGNTHDQFQEVVAKYQAANPKPGLPEEARKFKVQAEFAMQEKQFAKAAELYNKALEIAPWWPEGHFNRALILGETKKYWEAMREMKRYLLLVPDAPDARAAQDKIYQWEGVAGAEPKDLKFRDCPDCPEMVVIPAGGTIGRSFAIGKTEVTQAQWTAIMGNNPSHFSGGLFTSNCGTDCPVEKVSCNDVKEFIQKLNAKTGKQYRLPSEAEWEYACRAGEQQEYCGSDSVDSVAWYYGNSGRTTHPVALKQPNAYGLYDMSGNVWEWVEDCVRRGGSWVSDAQITRAARRFGLEPVSVAASTGFVLPGCSRSIGSLGFALLHF
jgi:tetratricopeptide (TPR) repeat protein